MQVRDIPEQVHRTLKARAARSGVSLSEYVRAELARLAALPTPDELRERLHRLPPQKEPRETPELIIRKLRGPLT